MPDPMTMIAAFGGSAILAAMVLLFGHLLSRNGLAATGAVAAGAGFLAGAWFLGIRPDFPPLEDMDRLFLILLPILLGAEVGAVLLSRWPWAGWALRLCVALMAGRILLDGTIYISDVAGPGTREWSPIQETLILGGLASVLFLSWGFLLWQVSRVPTRTTSVTLMVTVLAAGLVVMLSGYATGGQLGFPLAGALLAGIFLVRPREMPGLVSVGIVGLFAILMLGLFFGNLTPLNAGLLFAAPIVAAVTELVFAERFGPWLRRGLPILLAAAPLVIALVFAQQKFVEHSSPSTASQGSSDSAAQDYMSFGK
jgi:hypothetical protein